MSSGLEISTSAISGGHNVSFVKKPEPVRKHDFFLAGFMLQIWIIVINVLPWFAWTGFSEECVDAVFNTNTDNENELLVFHNCVNKEHRNGILIGCTILLLGYPIGIAMIHFLRRVEQAFVVFINLDAFLSIFYASWMLCITILCTIIPGLGIMVAYYDWQFIDLYTGYAIQYQFFNLALIFHSCIILPLGLTVIATWCMELVIIYNCDCFKSVNYTIPNEKRLIMAGIPANQLKIGKIGTTIFSIIVIGVVAFAIITSTFEYNKDGFFSYHGPSQYFQIIIYVAWQMQALGLMSVSCKFDKIVDFMNASVEPLNPQV